jgi:hypothetical protein
MQGDDMNKPALDADFEAAVETAMETMQTATEPMKLSPEVNYEKLPPINSSIKEPHVQGEQARVDHANLIEKSRVLFEKQIDSLRVRIDAVNDQIAQSIVTRDQEIEMAEKAHRVRMQEHQRDLYQIKTLRAAVELAVAALGYE